MADGIKAFMEMGFNALEAEVYTFLLRHASSTGFIAVAAGAWKPAADVYKALETWKAGARCCWWTGASQETAVRFLRRNC